MGELDALTTRYNSETQAIAYEQQANNLLTKQILMFLPVKMPTVLVLQMQLVQE